MLQGIRKLHPRVLSVQSHVVSGYIGNKSAVFPLQLLGFEADAINSVQLSNHTGYNTVRGQTLSDKDLRDLMQGLSENNLDHYTHLLTGYVNSSSFLNQVASIVERLREKNPDLIYVCNPVLSGDGKSYETKELLSIYKNVIMPLATIVVVNLFEIELLTELKIRDDTLLWKAINRLHAKGCKTVVVSSAELGNTSTLNVFASSKKGDHPSHSKNVELKLIQSKHDIEEPEIVYHASVVT